MLGCGTDETFVVCKRSLQHFCRKRAPLLGCGRRRRRDTALGMVAFGEADLAFVMGQDAFLPTATRC
jgi:hypothetical protein